MKANFKLSKESVIKNEIKPEKEDEERAEITEEEFEEYMVKNGAAGSFMVFRSTSKKEEELGLEEL